MPYRVVYNHNGNWWEYRIIDAAGNTVKGGIVDPGLPSSVYAAETYAHALCGRMNRQADAEQERAWLYEKPLPVMARERMGV
jgi:hypothetical protein